MLRIERTILTLKNWIDETVDVIEKIKIAKGDFSGPQEAKSAAMVAERELPWFVHTRDERYFVLFDIEIPHEVYPFDYLIEVSTGREGEWDAVNPQLLAFVDGEIITGLDVNHRTIFIRPEWYGKKVEVGLHLYTGMAEGDLRFRIKLLKRNQIVYNAYHDLRVLKEVLEALPKSSEEARFLKQTLLELIYSIRLNDVNSQETIAGLKQLSELLEEKIYGNTSLMNRFTVYAVGHTHIDVAWLWDLRQTSEKVVRSFATALDLQRRYPEYKFMTSQPVLLEMLESKQPSVYQLVKKGVELGSWEVEGAMYLEADCNLIGGESMIRQIEMGQKYFKTKFGKLSRTLWLPDVFGYSAALPQILKSFGIELFVTSKISWNDTTALPFDSFRWVGIDGSEIQTQFITTASMETLNKGEHKTIYEGNCNATETLGSVLRHQQREVQPNVVMPFGYGDGGGGANEHMLENAKRLVKGIPGMPRMKMAHISDFIEAYEKTPKEKLPKWYGELYLEYHRGTYTTNTGIKQRHRKLENQLNIVERLNSLLHLKGTKIPVNLEQEWKTLLLNEFHDILPGTSIRRVYAEAYDQLDLAYETANEKLHEQLCDYKINTHKGAILFNPNGHSFSGILKFKSDGIESISSIKLGNDVFPVQRLNEHEYLTAVKSILPLSIQNVALIEETRNSENIGHMKQNPYQFETPYYRVEIDKKGSIKSLVDKKHNRELIKASGFGNRLAFYEDRPLRWDAWDINRDYTNFEIPLYNDPEVKFVEDGKVALIIEIKHQFRSSMVHQTLYFYKDHPRIDFETNVDWYEKQVLMKTLFDFDIHATEVKYDIQFGHVKRPVDANNPSNEAMFEVCAAHWGDVSEDDYGVALMSNDKFGYSYLDSSLGLSLIKSPTWPDESSDQGKHKFSYAIMPHEGDAIRGSVHHNAMSYSIPSMVLRGYQVSELTPQGIIEKLPENLMLESFRVIEEGVYEFRLVEHYNRRGKASLQFNNPPVYLKKMKLNGDFIEECLRNVNHWEFPYGPFEILTLRMIY